MEYYPFSSNQSTGPYYSKEVVLIWVLSLLTILAIITIIIIRSFCTKDSPFVDTETSTPLTSPASSSSSSSSPPSSWDVFLSFHGKDTRGNFTAHLYKALHDAGFKTFMDEPQLRKGEEISVGLLNAIHGSKICVVVLSDNFAYSKWCLNELLEILSCHRTNSHVVIPVFYYVNPSDVRHHRKGFMEGLRSQKNTHSVEIIHKWERALAAVGQLKGYHLEKNANENEADVIQEIVKSAEEVLQVSMKIHTEDYLFGVDSAVEEIYQKLRMESNDVRAIGICGMGGMGKTTIAQAFYNKYSNKFDISCFIENVKQNSQGASPLLWLLEQLLIKLLRKYVRKVTDLESGIRRLKQILCFNKALIVLDDFDRSIPLELQIKLCNLSSPGSRIIFTTRDTNMLNQLKVDVPEVDIYMVRRLGQNDSLELFSCYAFRKSMPPEIFRELSVRFVTYAEGLPLALKVLGSSLRGRDHVSFWEDKLKKVQNIPMGQIQDILQLSYDELDDEMDKSIFLDIVFFFVGKDKDDAVHIFKSCDFFPDLGIPILVERCLLTIDEGNKFRMHNLIQKMGRKVAHEEFKQGKGRRLRLYQKNACETLQNLEGAEHIEVLVLDLTTSRTADLTTSRTAAKIFTKLCKLRLLEIIDPHNIMGKFENSFPELRCMRWSHCPWTRVPAGFRPPKIVCLDMPFNQINTSWKPPAGLKSLNVSHSKLKTISNFRYLKLLERLLLYGCENLSKIHPTIGQLTNLGHLNLRRCRQLKELPESVGQLTLLRHFDLSGCENLNQLPETITQLTGLSHLYTSMCFNLKRLPEQMGNMQGLMTFDASYSAIEQLPDSFGELIKLVDLKLGHCPYLTSLPNSICKLELLKVLDLGWNYKLERLPAELGKMQSLEYLDANSTKIKEVPDSICLLSSLKVLNLRRCFVRFMPSNIWNLTSLSELRYPDSHQPSINLPERVKSTRLENLELTCDNIRSWLPVILSFSSLKELTILNMGQKFSTETYSLSKLSNLRSLFWSNLYVSSCNELPPNLQKFSVANNPTLEQLPDLSSLKCLTKLFIWNCISLQSLPPLPPHLQLLKVSDCRNLQDVPDLSTLKELEELAFVRCNDLKSVSLKESSLQARRLFSFRAYLPNREIPEWFTYTSRECKLSFEISPALGDNFLGIALWVVYKCKETDSPSNFKAVMTNKTKGTRKEFDIKVAIRNGVEVRSTVICKRAKDISVESGDRITVLIKRLLHCYVPNDFSLGGPYVIAGEVEVEICGAHIIQKTHITGS